MGAEKKFTHFWKLRKCAWKPEGRKRIECNKSREELVYILCAIQSVSPNVPPAFTTPLFFIVRLYTNIF